MKGKKLRKALGFRFSSFDGKQKLNPNAFTLVELIIVIAIIAVLAVAAFMMLTKWLGHSRDARKIGDMATIQKSLNIGFIEKPIYPVPDEKTGIVDNDSKVILWYQGVFGPEAAGEIDSLQKAPKNPTDDGYYKYSVTVDQKEYQIGTFLENGDEVSFGSIVKAAEGVAKVEGEYDGYITYIDGTDGKIIEVPSLILYSGTGINLTGTNDNIMIPGEVQGESFEIKKLEFDPTNPPTDLTEQVRDAFGVEDGIAKQIVEKNTTITPTDIVYESCLYQDVTVNNGESITRYATDTVPYGSECVSETLTCTDGEMSAGSGFNYISCIPEGASYCEANTFEDYDYENIIYGGTQDVTKSIALTEGHGTTDYSATLTCNEGTIEKSGETSEIVCDSGYTATIDSCEKNSLMTGILGYWDFDDGVGSTAVDKTGNGNDLNLGSQATWTTGKIGQTAKIVDGRMGTSDRSFSAPVKSVSFWFKLVDTTDLHGTVVAFDNPSVDASAEDNLGQYGDANYYGSNSCYSAGYDQQIVYGKFVADTNWHFMSISKSTNTIVCLDGTCTETGIDGTSSISNPTNIVLNGGIGCGFGNFENGVYIDDLRFFSSTFNVSQHEQIYTDSGGSAVTIVDYNSGKRYSNGTYEKDCKAYLESNVYANNGNGAYWIKPGVGVDAFKTYCDMSSDGGGWTLIATLDKTSQAAEGWLGASPVNITNLSASSMVDASVNTSMLQTIKPTEFRFHPGGASDNLNLSKYFYIKPSYTIDHSKLFNVGARTSVQSDSEATKHTWYWTNDGGANKRIGRTRLVPSYLMYYRSGTNCSGNPCGVIDFDIRTTGSANIAHWSRAGEGWGSYTGLVASYNGFSCGQSTDDSNYNVNFGTYSGKLCSNSNALTNHYNSGARGLGIFVR